MQAETPKDRMSEEKVMGEINQSSSHITITLRAMPVEAQQRGLADYIAAHPGVRALTIVVDKGLNTSGTLETGRTIEVTDSFLHTMREIFGDTLVHIDGV